MKQKGHTLKDETELLLRLYDTTFADEEQHIQLEQKSLTLFTSLILAVIGGVFLLITEENTDQVIKFAGLIIGGVIVLALRPLAVRAYQSNYRRHIEAVVRRAKLDDLLDLGNLKKFGGRSVWQNEALILPRHLRDRKQFNDSEKFVQDKVEKGYAIVVKRMFTMLAIAGGVLILLGIYQLVRLMSAPQG